VPIRSWAQAEISLRAVLFRSRRRPEERGVLFAPDRGAVLLKTDKPFQVPKSVRPGDLDFLKAGSFPASFVCFFEDEAHYFATKQ
jgi:hypothetical protein